MKEKTIFNQLKILKPKVITSIPPTIVVTIIFFMTYYLFGPENSLIGPFATLSFMRYKTMNNRYECMVKNFGIFAIMAVLSYLAVLNLPLCIVVNAFALFLIGAVLIDEYNPTNYMPIGLSLIFFQISPASTPKALGIRIGAIGATFVLVFIFVFVLTKINRRTDPLPPLIGEGFEICNKLINDNPEDENLHHKLCDIGKACSQEIYSYNRSTFRKFGKVNWYCHFLIVFQLINVLTDNHESENSMNRAKAIYTKYKSEFDTVKPTSEYRRINLRLKKVDIRSFRIRFALRQLSVLTPCLVFAYITGWQNVYWLVISVFVMLVPFTDHTKQRVKQRLLGTIAGIIICLILFSAFPGFPARVVIMTIANFMSYGANGYGPTVAYITCSALALQTLDGAVLMILLQRLIYTVVGAGIALFANRFIFPVRFRYQVQFLTEKINGLREQLFNILATTKRGEERRRKEIDQSIVQSYLLLNRLGEMASSIKDDDFEFDFTEFKKEHIFKIAEYMDKYL